MFINNVKCRNISSYFLNIPINKMIFLKTINKLIYNFMFNYLSGLYEYNIQKL